VPGAAAQAQAEAAIRGVFKAAYAKRRQADRLALAAKLLEQAKETKTDPAARFVLLREAQALAANAADPVLALRAIEAMAQDFAVDALALKTAALETAGRSVIRPASNQAVLVTSLATVDECLAADNFELAPRLVKVAENAAGKMRARQLSAYVRARANEVDRLGKEYEGVKAAMATLRHDPRDPDANLAVGRYYCLAKWDWAKGLPMLARGADGQLKEIAKQELAGPVEPARQFGLGEAWQRVADGEKGTARTHALLRADYWYQQGAERLEGFSKTKVEKSISDLEETLPVEALLRLYEGKWVITYANSAVRHYILDARGNVTFSEADQRATLTRINGQLLLAFGDGKLERVKLVDGKLQVEHFNPPSDYPNKPNTTGVGTRQP
jgi:hypothetical protein